MPGLTSAESMNVSTVPSPDGVYEYQTVPAVEKSHAGGGSGGSVVAVRGSTESLNGTVEICIAFAKSSLVGASAKAPAGQSNAAATATPAGRILRIIVFLLGPPGAPMSAECAEDSKGLASPQA